MEMGEAIAKLSATEEKEMGFPFDTKKMLKAVSKRPTKRRTGMFFTRRLNVMGSMCFRFFKSYESYSKNVTSWQEC
jgi:hypothetical protein